MGTRAYVGRPDPTDPTVLHLRSIHTDADPDRIVPAITGIRHFTFAGDTPATVAALLEYDWANLGVAMTPEQITAAGYTPVTGIGMIFPGVDVEAPISLPVTRLGELTARWVYVIDPHADTLTVLSTDDPTTPVATHTFPSTTPDPATAEQPSPHAAGATPSCTCRQRAERAEARLAAYLAHYEAQAVQVRRHVRDGVAAGNFDLDVTNDLLERLGLEPLPRYWTVNLHVAMTVTVAATASDDAFDTARVLVENVMEATEIVDEYDINDVDNAIPGDLADEPATNPATDPARRRSSRPVRT